MATRTRLERCQWCSNQLSVPIHVQIITCPVCRYTTRLAPATNTGTYQQQPLPPPTGMYNGFNQQPYRLPSYSHQQSMRPQENTNSSPPLLVGMYNNGFGRRPTFSHQQSMRPYANYDNGYSTSSSGESDDDASIPTMNNNGGYNQQASVPPVNNNGGYNQQASVPPVNNNGGYSNQVSPRPMSNTNGNSGYNHQASIRPMKNNSGYSNQVSPRPMSNTNGNGWYNHQASIPPVNIGGSYNNQVSPRPMNNSYGNGGYNNQVSPWPMNNNGGYNGYHQQQTRAPPIYNNYGNYNNVSPTPPKHEKKRAVLCGISYMNTPHSLDGSVTDVESIKSLLIDTMGFPNSSIIVLTEVESNPMRIPTSKNIITSLRWLVQGCQAGDSLVFYYTGHGSRVADDGDDEYDGYDEALCPVDYKTAGKLLDDQINEIIVRPLPRGVQLHSIIDTCYSGTALDLCYINRSNSRGKYFWEDHDNSNGAYQGTNGGLAVCISACDDHQQSGNTTAFTGNATGALTYSLVKALRSEPTSTYGLLMNNMRTEISSVQSGLGLNASNASASTQEPQLSSSEKFNIYSKKIVL